MKTFLILLMVLLTLGYSSVNNKDSLSQCENLFSSTWKPYRFYNGITSNIFLETIFNSSNVRYQMEPSSITVNQPAKNTSTSDTQYNLQYQRIVNWDQQYSQQYPYIGNSTLLMQDLQNVATYNIKQTQQFSSLFPNFQSTYSMNYFFKISLFNNQSLNNTESPTQLNYTLNSFNATPSVNQTIQNITSNTTIIDLKKESFWPTYQRSKRTNPDEFTQKITDFRQINNFYNQELINKDPDCTCDTNFCFKTYDSDYYQYNQTEYIYYVDKIKNQSSTSTRTQKYYTNTSSQYQVDFSISNFSQETNQVNYTFLNQTVFKYENISTQSKGQCYDLIVLSEFTLVDCIEQVDNTHEYWNLTRNQEFNITENILLVNSTSDNYYNITTSLVNQTYNVTKQYVDSFLYIEGINANNATQQEGSYHKNIRYKGEPTDKTCFFIDSTNVSYDASTWGSPTPNFTTWFNNSIYNKTDQKLQQLAYQYIESQQTLNYQTNVTGPFYVNRTYNNQITRQIINYTLLREEYIYNESNTFIEPTKFYHKIYLLKSNSTSIDLVNTFYFQNQDISDFPQSKKLRIINDYLNQEQQNSILLMSATPQLSKLKQDQQLNSTIQLLKFNKINQIIELIGNIGAQNFSDQPSSFNLTDCDTNGTEVYTLEQNGVVRNFKVTDNGENSVLNSTILIQSNSSSLGNSYTLSVSPRLSDTEIIVQYDSQIIVYYLSENKSEHVAYSSYQYNNSNPVSSRIVNSDNYFILMDQIDWRQGGNTVVYKKETVTNFIISGYQPILPFWENFIDQNFLFPLSDDTFMFFTNYSDYSYPQFYSQHYQKPYLQVYGSSSFTQPTNFTLTANSLNNNNYRQQSLVSCSMILEIGVIDADSAEPVYDGKEQNSTVERDTANDFSSRSLMVTPTLPYQIPSINLEFFGVSDYINVQDVTIKMQSYYQFSDSPQWILFTSGSPGQQQSYLYASNKTNSLQLCQVGGFYDIGQQNQACSKYNNIYDSNILQTFISSEGLAYMVLQQSGLSSQLDLVLINQTLQPLQQFTLPNNYYIQGEPQFLEQQSSLDKNLYLFGILKNSISNQSMVFEFFNNKIVQNQTDLNIISGFSYPSQLITNSIEFPNLIALAFQDSYLYFIEIIDLKWKLISTIYIDIYSSIYLVKNNLIVQYFNEISEYSLIDLKNPILTKQYPMFNFLIPYEYRSAIASQTTNMVYIVSYREDDSILQNIKQNQNLNTRHKNQINSSNKYFLLVYKPDVQPQETLYQAYPLDLDDVDDGGYIYSKTLKNLVVSQKLPNQQSYQSQQPDDIVIVEFELEYFSFNKTKQLIVQVFKDNKIFVDQKININEAITLKQQKNDFKGNRIQKNQGKSSTNNLQSLKQSPNSNPYQLPCYFGLKMKSSLNSSFESTVSSKITCTLFSSNTILTPNTTKMKESGILDAELTLSSDTLEQQFNFTVSGWFSGSVLGYKLVSDQSFSQQQNNQLYSNKQQNIEFTSNVYTEQIEQDYLLHIVNLYFDRQSEKTFAIVFDKQQNLNKLISFTDIQDSNNTLNLFEIHDSSLKCSRIIPIIDQKQDTLVNLQLHCQYNTDSSRLYFIDISKQSSSNNQYFQFTSLAPNSYSRAVFLQSSQYLIVKSVDFSINYYKLDWSKVTLNNQVNGSIYQITPSSDNILIRDFIFYDINNDYQMGLVLQSVNPKLANPEAVNFNCHLRAMIISKDDNFSVLQDKCINFKQMLSDQQVFVNFESIPIRVDAYSINNNYQQTLQQANMQSTTQTILIQAFMLFSNAPIYDISLTFTIDSGAPFAVVGQSLTVNCVYNNYGERFFIPPNDYQSSLISMDQSQILRSNNYLVVIFIDSQSGKLQDCETLYDCDLYAIFYEINEQHPGTQTGETFVAGINLNASQRGDRVSLQFTKTKGEFKVLQVNKDSSGEATSLNLISGLSSSIIIKYKRDNSDQDESFDYSIVADTIYEDEQGASPMQIEFKVKLVATPQNESWWTGLRIGLVIGGSVLFVALLGLLIYWLIKRRKKNEDEQFLFNENQDEVAPSGTAKSDK